MRFYEDTLPKEKDYIVAIVTDYEKGSSYIQATLPEYENIVAFIFTRGVAKSKKAIRKFVGRRRGKETPFFVDNVEGGMPNLIPIWPDQGWEKVMNRYNLTKHMASLTDDILFQTKDNDELSPDLVKKMLLWEPNEKFKDMDNDVQEDMFSYYLGHIKELMDLFDANENNENSSEREHLKQYVQKAIIDRMTTNEVTMIDYLHVMVVSSHGLTVLNSLVDIIARNVDGLYYQDVPWYKVVIKGINEMDCKEKLSALQDKLTDYAKDNNATIILDYNPDRLDESEKFKEKFVRLKPLNKTKWIESRK